MARMKITRTHFCDPTPWMPRADHVRYILRARRQSFTGMGLMRLRDPLVQAPCLVEVTYTRRSSERLKDVYDVGHIKIKDKPSHYRGTARDSCCQTGFRINHNWL
ncbi:hypothetical protein C1H76_8492 [Elsinoe australis]|uniref:Uncharacterized protein n=1 Tax=Elsinoe australis TaxID=40998 RepID=A0A4U7AS81_9PEZI|nr:hypothetical protein C1H76_8492 [Elsinoe australis]